MFFSVSRAHHFLLIVIVASFVYSASATIKLPRFPLTVIHEFPSPSWIENIAIRENGDLLVTSLSSPSVFLVDRFSRQPPVLVTTIPQATGVAGIAELENDVFYVAAGNLTGLAPVQGSSAVWKVDLRSSNDENCGNSSTAAKTELVTSIPDAIFLNGVCRLSSTDDSKLLISDSILGSIFLVEVAAKTYTISMTDPALSANGSTTGLAAGVNGIHVHGSDLFFMNLANATFFKVRFGYLSTGGESLLRPALEWQGLKQI